MGTTEQISIFDMFKIGIGPSSSHTLGPWRAAERFLKILIEENNLEKVDQLYIDLYGSLAKTGIGHGTDVAILLGLSGCDPITFDVDLVISTYEKIKSGRKLIIAGSHSVEFHYQKEMVFHYDESLKFHPNGMKFQAILSDGRIVSSTYYSIGGGFVVQESETKNLNEEVDISYPINNAYELIQYTEETKLSIADIVFKNELAWRDHSETIKGLDQVFDVFCSSIYKGCHSFGVLPGGLNVERRAGMLNKKLLGERTYSSFSDWLFNIKSGGQTFEYIIDWVSCFALAVNEENASFGRVVTSPTNGSAGVIPSVLFYLYIFRSEMDRDLIYSFLATASEIGSIFKKGATISAAMGGCQAEIGVSSAMAAAALTVCLGGSAKQGVMAAEIAMEHHLGLTCDPIGGLVQIPCIERNSMGAIKAILASQLALKSDPSKAKVSLDAVVATMWETALDMNVKYKETADGGLAIKVPISLPEC